MLLLTKHTDLRDEGWMKISQVFDRDQLLLGLALLSQMLKSLQLGNVTRIVAPADILMFQFPRVQRELLCQY